jgi:hypothetical protein
MFAKLKAQHDELELLIKTKMEEKELFSEQCSKASRQITMFQEMIELIHQGSIDARCKWIWEKGSIRGFMQHFLARLSIQRWFFDTQIVLQHRRC